MVSDKKYYWIKLKTNFFSEDEIDFLLSQKNGCQYVVLYQMLCLKTANTNGKLQKELGEIIVPYDIDKIVRDTKYFDFDTITVALELYKRLNLVYVDDNGTLAITNHNEMIGSETIWAQKKREYRENQKMLGQSKRQKEDIVRQEYRDKSIEYRDKSIEINNKEKNIKKETYVSILDNYTSNEQLKTSLNDFVKMRKKMKGFTTSALRLALNKLNSLALDDETKIKIVNQSVMNSWKSFYELKEKKNNLEDLVF